LPLSCAAVWMDAEPKLRSLTHGVTFAADGVRYALNGAAKSTGQFQDVNPTLRDTSGYVEINDTRVPAKQGVGPLVVRGLDLCPE
jgi:hypothetical protein